MGNFTVYDALTGEIRRTGTCPDEMLAIQAAEGETAIAGAYDAIRCYIDDGQPVDKPASPGPNHEWNPTARAWTPIPLATVRASAAAAALSQRRALLAASDWTQLPDVPLATREAWAAYRQALRDITEQPGYPENITWPIAPEQ